MKTAKLFQVLVVGGALLSSVGVPENLNSPVVEKDEPQTQSELILCDANDPETCVSSCGKKTVKEGFECCWGTSCE